MPLERKPLQTWWNKWSDLLVFLSLCCRLYPLNQRDMPLERKQLDFGPLLPASVAIDNPSRDYTPPQVG